MSAVLKCDMISKVFYLQLSSPRVNFWGILLKHFSPGWVELDRSSSQKTIPCHLILRLWLQSHGRTQYIGLLKCLSRCLNLVAFVLFFFFSHHILIVSEICTQKLHTSSLKVAFIKSYQIREGSLLELRFRSQCSLGSDYWLLCCFRHLTSPLSVSPPPAAATSVRPQFKSRFFVENNRVLCLGLGRGGGVGHRHPAALCFLDHLTTGPVN